MQAAVNRDVGYRAMDAVSYELIRLTTNADIKAEAKEGKVDMCIAIQEIRAEGRAEGVVISIRNLMRNMNYDVAQAMEVLGVPPEERDRYAAMAAAVQP